VWRLGLHTLAVLIPLAVDTQRDNAGVLYAAVTDASGKVLAHSDNSMNGRPFSLEHPSPLPEDAGVSEASLKGAWVWDVSAAIVPKEKNIQLGMVHVGISRSAVEPLRWRTLASAPATRTGESEVVKMKPGA